jgi:DNA modification methylase
VVVWVVADATINGSETDKLQLKHTLGKVAEQSVRENCFIYAVGNEKFNSGGKHPAIFPEDLARDHILSWSNPSNLVFDPMCGSGTTLKMAMQNGRHFLGFDISPEYVELAKKRVEWANPPLLVIG